MCVIRNCVLCRSELRILTQSKWDIPGLGEKIIGFSHCDLCGMVMQNPTVTLAEMLSYYETTAVYTRFSKDYKPKKEKLKSVKRNLTDLLSVTGSMPASVLQVGCSDGYTLSRFRDAGAHYVLGVDPSQLNNRVAKDVYNVDSVCIEFERFEPEQRFDLAVLTHILEHLYEPRRSLGKCNQLLNSGGWMLAEVPLLEKEQYFSTGYLAFEHVNYFTEKLFVQMVESCGFEVHIVNKVFKAYRYPVVTVIAQKVTKPDDGFTFHLDDESEGVTQRFLQIDQSNWQRIERRLSAGIPAGADIYVWGAGIHTAQLFSNTDILSRYKVQALIDSSETKWGKSIAGVQCVRPDAAMLHNSKIVVISTCASENEVYENLSAQYSDSLKLFRLYHDA